MIKLLALLLVLAIEAAVVTANAQEGSAPCVKSYATDRRTGKPAPTDCGRRAGPSRDFQIRTTGGEAAPNERYTAAIFYRDDQDKLNICTGVLLDVRYLLTAGHCGCGKEGSYSVTFSQSALRGDQVIGGIGIEGAPILFDPMTCSRGVAPGNDLALIRLDRNMVTNPRNLGYPIVLAANYRDKMQPARTLKVVGYGDTETGSVANRMMTTVPVLTPDCLELPYRTYCAPFQEMIMADRSGSGVPHDSCGGDSGGPIYVKTKVKLPYCVEDQGERNPYENLPDKDWHDVEQDVLVAITSRAAPFTQPLAGMHCGGGAINTLIGRRPVFAWFEANGVRPQRCVFQK